MKKTDQVLMILLLPMIIANFFLITGSSAVIVIVLGFAVFFYSFLGFAIFNQIRLRNVFKKNSYTNTSFTRIIGAIVTGIVIGYFLLGIMYKTMMWPGYEGITVAALGTGGIYSLFFLIFTFIKKSDYYYFIGNRIALYGGVFFLLFIIPTDTFVHFKFRNYPTYIEAWDNLQSNPSDNELRKKLEEERKKIHFTSETNESANSR